MTDRNELDEAGASSPEPPSPPALSPPPGDDLEGPSSADYSVAFSPRNLAVGLAVVAGLVAFAASRRRRRTSGEND